MKKTLILALVAAVGLLAGQQASAQVTDVTDPVNVSIDLSASVISIQLGGTPDVEFVYDEASDYTQTQTVNKTAHFTVVSNGAYNISVTAMSTFSSPSSEDLPLDLVTVAVDPTTDNEGDLSDVTLSMDEAALVSNAVASNNAVYNVIYSIPDPTDLVSLPKEIYTTTVRYTATQL